VKERCGGRGKRRKGARETEEQGDGRWRRDGRKKGRIHRANEAGTGAKEKIQREND